LQDQKLQREILVIFFYKDNTKSSGPQGEVKSADVWKTICFLKVAFFIVFSLMWRITQIKDLLIFLVACAAMTGQTVPSETDQALVILCPHGLALQSQHFGSPSFVS